MKDRNNPTPEEKAALDAWLMAKAQCLAYKIMIKQAGAELVQVCYALGRPPGEAAGYLTRIKDNTREMTAQLQQLMVQAYFLAGQYSMAWRVANDIVTNFSELKNVVLEAANKMSEIPLMQGIMKKGDASDIDMQEWAKVVVMVEGIEAQDKGQYEAKADILFKGVAADGAAILQHGLEIDPDGEFRRENGSLVYTERGKAIHAEYQGIMEKMKKVITDAGLDTSSCAKQMYDMFDEQTELTAGMVDTYQQVMGGQADPYKRGEMKFALGMRLQLAGNRFDRDRGRAMLDEIVKEDTLKEYWFTRFLQEYLKEKPTTVSPLHSET